MGALPGHIRPELKGNESFLNCVRRTLTSLEREAEKSNDVSLDFDCANTNEALALAAFLPNLFLEASRRVARQGSVDKNLGEDWYRHDGNDVYTFGDVMRLAITTDAQKHSIQLTFNGTAKKAALFEEASSLLWSIRQELIEDARIPPQGMLPEDWRMYQCDDESRRNLLFEFVRGALIAHGEITEDFCRTDDSCRKMEQGFRLKTPGKSYEVTRPTLAVSLTSCEGVPALENPAWSRD